MQTTVGVPTYRRPDTLDRLLDALLEGSVTPDGVIIVDDGDGDETAAVVDAHRGSVDDVRFRYVSRSDGDGLPDARNAILERCRGDVLCFLDDDTLPRADWLRAIVDTYRHRPTVAAVGGPALHADRDLSLVAPVDSSDHNRNVITRYGEVNIAAARWVPPRPVPTDALVGANMSFRTDVLTAVEGFDPGYGGTAVHEETDVMVRLTAAGHELLYHPAASVYHFKSDGGVHAGQNSRDQCYWAARNDVRFRWKHYRDRFPTSLLRAVCWTYGVAPDWRESFPAALGRLVERRLPDGSAAVHTGVRRSGRESLHDVWRALICSYGSAPLWKKLSDGARHDDAAPLGWVAGYLDGIRYETDVDLPGFDSDQGGNH